MRPTFAIVSVVGALLLARGAHAAFPDGFLWGSAISGFQSEMGGDPASNDPGSDWWVWVHDADNIAAHRVSGDLPEDGPAFWDEYRTQIRRNARRGLGSNALRLSIEWSRIFPTSTQSVDASGGITLDVLQQLDALADQDAVRYYRRILFRARAARMEPFVTVNHFSLPLWIHDPIAARNALAMTPPNSPPPTGFGPAGWLDPVTVEEFRKYAAYVAWKLGRYVDFWAPVNEPLSVAAGGYANVPGAFASNFPPGVLSYTGLLQVVLNLIEAQRVGYDAIKQWDLRDADRDGTDAVVGVVINMIRFAPYVPGNANDERGAEHGDYLYNRLFANAVFLGDVDVNANGVADPGEHRPDLVGHADFFGLNYYFRGKALGLGAPVTPAIPLFDFLPIFTYQTPHRPVGPLCPTECSDFGWEIYPPGLRDVLTTAAGYGRPIYITENGIADADDDQRPAYLVQHLAVLEQAITDGVADVRGYFHWSLEDNFEWATGYFTQFGLYRVDADKVLRPRASAEFFRQIAESNAIPQALLDRFGP
jgi:beta-glucosidase/6-phospho-beta-glucosidase/beta-galactosidase